MIPPRDRGSGSGSRSRTHGKDLLNSSSGDDKSRHGGNGKGATVAATGVGWPRLELP